MAFISSPLLTFIGFPPSDFYALLIWNLWLFVIWSLLERLLAMPVPVPTHIPPWWTLLQFQIMKKRKMKMTLCVLHLFHAHTCP